VVNDREFVAGLKACGALQFGTFTLASGKTSDYYVVGYYSSNPDPTKRRRSIEVKVKRPNVNLNYRTQYVLKPNPVK